MLNYPEFNPVALSLGSLQIRWYGVCYVFGFLGCLFLAVWRGRNTQWTLDKLTNVLFYVALGIIFGGRAGYMLFYFPEYILSNPMSLFAFWEPGRSFHGGLLGVLVALLVYTRFSWRAFIELTDFIAPVVPIGIGFGRLGNFINAELYGRATTVPWGMVFPNGGPLARHPSQLYELLLEGVILCLWLLWYARKPRKLGAVSGMFLLGYGLMRSLVELVREPDITHGFVMANFLTMGQLLSVPMIILGIYFICRRT